MASPDSLPTTQRVASEADSPAARFAPLRHAPAYKSVSLRIEQSILSGALQPGTPLPGEQELASQFEVNRSTVREAIRLLEQEGMVERRAGRRLFVTIPGIFELAPRATRALVLMQVTFEELWQVAVLLEPCAARQAAALASDADLDGLEAKVAEADAALKPLSGKTIDYRQLALLDVEFHAQIARIGGNRALMLAREPISLLYSPAMAQLQAVLPQASKRNWEAHRRIVRALRARAAGLAEDWMRKHLLDFKRGYVISGVAMDSPVEGLVAPAAAQGAQPPAVQGGAKR